MAFSLLILLAAVLIRVALMPSPGFPTDVGAFASWMHALVDVGPRGMYLDLSNRLFPVVDYPPGYLYVLWALGILERALFGLHPSIIVDRVFVKLPAVCADLIVAWRLRSLLQTMHTSRAATIGFAIMLLAPMLWFISAVWGQVDVIAALVLVLSLEAALRSRFALMWVLLAIAISIKPQPIVTAPLFFIFQAYRSRNFSRTWFYPLLALVTAYVIALPAAPSARPDLTLRWLLERYTFGVAKYPNGSSGAFNFYTVFGNGYQPDSTVLFGVSLHTLGTLATLIVIAAVSAYLAFTLRAIARDVSSSAAPRAAASIFCGSLIVVLLGLFLCTTRMHERYEMCAIVLLPLFAAAGRIEMRISSVLWVGFCVNTALIFVGFYGGHHHPQIKYLVHFISITNIAGAVAVSAAWVKSARDVIRAQAQLVV